MGKEKTTTVIDQTQKATPTPEEVEYNKIRNEQFKQTAQPQTDIQLSGLNLINRLLRGETDLPGFFGQIGQGLQGDYSLNPNEYMIGESQIQEIVQNSLKDLYPQFQSQGILDSGTAASVAGRTAGDIRRNVLEGNLSTRLGINQSNNAMRMGMQESNLGNKVNLLNLALSGQGQVQAPLLAQSQMMGNQLAGLRSMNTQGTTTSYGMNPFLKSFQQSMGQTLGSPSFTTGAKFAGFGF